MQINIVSKGELLVGIEDEEIPNREGFRQSVANRLA